MPVQKRVLSVLEAPSGALEQRTQSSKPAPVARAQFTEEAVQKPAELARQLQTMGDNLAEALGNVRGNPLASGVILRGVRLKGPLAQVAAIAGANATIWYHQNAPLFSPGDVIVACTTDMNSVGAVRAGSATVSTATSAGVVTATAGWVAGIAALVVGDWLFRSGEPATETVVKHSLGQVPRWVLVLATTKGAVQPQVALVSGTTSTVNLLASHAAVVDLLVVP